ncbi:MAG: VWA domain-containing protein [Alphaproteobacteria bacterium]|jgi:hypothetical protein|nr:VWA domain-containing protein [Alphaproteobacteria bacterium]
MKRLIAAFAAAILPLSASCAQAEATETEDEVHSYILLDRTGSMSGIWDEALSSVNAYAASVAEEEAGGPDTLSTQVTLAVFDSQDGLQFDVLRRGVNADTWSPVTDDEASPRGMTPLFDAIGRIVGLAEGDKPERAVLVIMTDGHENASREMTKDGAKAALDRVRAKGFEVVFLGAEFASFDDADAVGVSGAKSMAVGQGSMQDTMQRLGKKSRAYGKGEDAEIEFDAEDRVVANEEDVKERKGN